MPTTSFLPSTPGTEDDDDLGFSAGLTNDLQQNTDAMPQSPAAPAPAPTPQTPTNELGAALPTASAPAAPDPNQAPQYEPPDRTELRKWENTLQTDQQPLNRADYKPKWWERTLGGLSAGLMAFDKLPNAVEEGSAVTNRGYLAADADRQRRVGADQTGLTAAQQDLQQKQQDYEEALKGYNANELGEQRSQHAAEFAAQEKQRLAGVAPSTLQPDDPKNPMGSWHGQTIGGQPVKLNQPPDSWLKSPAGKQAIIIDTMTKAGVQPGSEDWKYGLVNGKLKEPAASTNIHIPSAELQKYEDRKAAAVRENGGKPLSASQLADLSKDGPTGLPINQWQGLISKRDAAYAKALSDHQASLKNAIGTKDKTLENARYQGQLGSLQSEWNDRLSQADPEGRYAQGTGSSNAAAPAPAAASVPPQQVALPPQAASRLKEGVATTFGANGTWTLQNGQPTRLR